MKKQYIIWILKFGISAFLIFYVFRNHGIQNEIDAFSKASIDYIIIGLALCIAQVIFGALRWDLVIGALLARPPLRKTIGVYWISIFFSMVLPGAISGDVTRVIFARRSGLSLSSAINTVLIERILTVHTLILLVAFSQPLLLWRIGYIPNAWVFPSLAVIGAIGWATLSFVEFLPFGMEKFRVTRGLFMLSRHARGFITNFKFCAIAVLVAFVGHLNQALTVYVFALALHQPVQFFDCVVLVPPVLLIMVLPISIAGWGVRETAMIAAFGLVGIPANSAMIVSVLYGLVSLLAALPGLVEFLIEKSANKEANLDLA